MPKTPLHTNHAPAAIGCYSQAVRHGDLLYISGQIPLLPDGSLANIKDFSAAARQVFENLSAIAEAAGAGLQDTVKLTIYLTDLGNFAELNTIMAEYFSEPYPARVTVGVADLPKGVPIEIEGLVALSG